MAAYWLRGNTSPKGLTYYSALDIRNEETLPVITSVLKKKTGQTMMPKWPGLKVWISEEEGHVLLGEFLIHPALMRQQSSNEHPPISTDPYSSANTTLYFPTSA
jgi:hypothetical protein